MAEVEYLKAHGGVLIAVDADQRLRYERIQSRQSESDAVTFEKFIEQDLRKGKNVLVVASHNSLRAIVKYVEKISDKDIINVEIIYGGIKIYAR